MFFEISLTTCFRLLKEKKKLTSKIDSLTRKVNTLQSRLAATTNSASDAPSLVPSQPAVSHQLPPPPPPPTFTKSTITPLAVPSFMPGPSHSRPKTPEPRLPPPPVFKARTPEAKRAPPKPLRDHPAVPQPSTSAGKKRLSPYYFEYF